VKLLVFVVFFLAGCSNRPPAEKAEVQPQSGVVELGPEAQDHFGLQVSAVEPADLAEQLQVTGTVQPVTSRVTQVRPLARGRIQDVLAQVGDRVRTGQPLARIDNIEAGEMAAQLASARAELARLNVQIARHAREAERSRRLTELGAAARREYEESLAEHQALEQLAKSQQSTIAGLTANLKRFGALDATPGAPVITELRAPFGGVVTASEAAPGATFGPEASLFTVADLSTVWVQAEVYEKDLGRIRVGQTARITVDTYPDTAFTGKVTYIADVLDHQTRTAKVRCEVSNRDARLKLDMFAAIDLPTTFRRTALAVPADAIQQIDGRYVVFVRKDARRFEARDITPGRTVAGVVEVANGLKAGEQVVKQGAFHLKSVLVGKELGEE
jgi:cobalt-zinc-cadmium efflux system membrane fusion protein